MLKNIEQKIKQKCQTARRNKPPAVPQVSADIKHGALVIKTDGIKDLRVNGKKWRNIMLKEIGISALKNLQQGVFEAALDCPDKLKEIKDFFGETAYAEINTHKEKIAECKNKSPILSKLQQSYGKTFAAC